MQKILSRCLFVLSLLVLGNPNAVFSQCNGLHFDGQNDYIQANSPLTGNTNFTVEMWFRDDSPNSGGSCDDNSLADFRWLIGWDDNQFGLGTCQGNLGVVFRPACPTISGLCLDFPGVSVQDGEWHHVAISKTNAEIHVLLDGELLGSFASANYDLSGTYRLGSSGSGTVGKNWLGAIDEVHIWNVARTDAEIQANAFCQLALNTPGIRSIFHANLGTAGGANTGLNTLDDIGPANQDGTLTNFALDGAISNWVEGPSLLCDNNCPPPAGDLVQISPFGLVSWPPDTARVFRWTEQAGAGLYRLKILKLAPGQEAPLVLPNAGLFYDNPDISGTSFALPGAVPPFKEGERYAWQVSTTADGMLRLGGPIVIVIGPLPPPLPIFPLNLTISGCPTMVCPGDCFLVKVNFSPTYWYTPINNLIVFSDCPNVTVQVLGGNPPSLTPGTCPVPNTPLPPPIYTGFAISKWVRVCVNKACPPNTPLNLCFYGWRGSGCQTTPLAPACDHDIKTCAVAVANVPCYAGLQLQIEDQVTHLPLSQICSGDPVTVCLRDAAGNPVPAGSPAGVITWECGPCPWPWCLSPVPASYNFSSSQFYFQVPPGFLTTTVCAVPSKGYEDRWFRAKIVVTDPVTGKVCTKYSTLKKLRICCPVPKPTVTVNVVPPSLLNGTLCDGDVATLNVALTGLPAWFGPLPGSVVMIDWYVKNGSGTYVLYPTPPLSTGFSYPAVMVLYPMICFKAIIKNCSCPQMEAEFCIQVDKKPKCGGIIACSPNLMPTSTPGCYDICPGLPAAVCFDPNNPFKDCIPQWQYSFNQTTWLPTGGSGNPTQNTGTLPWDDNLAPYIWPTGATCIYYRVCCQPLTYPAPSGCEPCYSNILKICLKPLPAAPVVTISQAKICKGLSATLTATPAPNPPSAYTWYFNGIAVGSGGTYTATQEGWYWVCTTNACGEVLESNHVFLKVCMVMARLSCPLDPNPCAKLGDPIYMTACNSTSTCGGPLTYTWTVTPLSSNFIIHANDCDIEDTQTSTTPTTYCVTVTDPCGCMDTACMMVDPCN